MRGFAVLLLAAGLSGCAAPVKVPENSKLIFLGPASISFTSDFIPDGQIFVVDDFSGKVVASFPHKKSSGINVGGLTKGKRYRVYLVPQ